jgi:hypothetical protein
MLIVGIAVKKARVFGSAVYARVALSLGNATWSEKPTLKMP